MPSIYFNRRLVELTPRRRRKPRRALKAREVVEAMRDLALGGDTLKSIGARYGITRERVRQLLKEHFGITSANGGAFVRAARREAELSDHLEKYRGEWIPRYGCTRGEALDIPARVRDLYQNYLAYEGRMKRKPALTLPAYFAARASGDLPRKRGPKGPRKSIA